MTDQESIVFLFELLGQPATGLQASLAAVPISAWPRIQDCAERQNVTPYLYFHITRNTRTMALPASVLKELQQNYHANAARNLRILHQLGTILGLLGAKQVPVIVLKGALLASAIYPNPAVRTMGDIDVLLRADDVEAAIDALRELGYRRLLPPWVNTPCHVGLSAPDGGADLEIHWDLADPSDYCRIPMEVVWERAVQIEIAGANALALAPEELLLHLCYHSAIKHLFMQGVRSFIDVDVAVRHHQASLDWNYITSASAAWGLHRAVALTLFLCRQYLNTPVPNTLFEDSEFIKVAPALAEEALVQMSAKPGAIDVVRADLLEVQGEQGRTKKANRLLGYVLRLPDTPAQPSAERSRLATLYYVFRRLIYLVGRYSGTIWRLAFVDRGEAGHSDTGFHLMQWLRS